MANLDAPNGFIPLRHARGGLVRHSDGYTIASGYASNIFSGDPVKSSGTGKGITVAAAGETARGVFDGCRYIDSQGDVQFKPYWPANTVATDIEASVLDDPDIIFEIQCDGAFAAADVGQKVDWVAGAGDPKIGRSKYELDSSDIGTGAGLLILGLIQRPDNDYGNFAKVEVLIAEHELRGALVAT